MTMRSFGHPLFINPRQSPALERQKRVLWLTGLSGAGRSTIANGLAAMLSAMGLRAVVLDGDDLRNGLCADLGFAPQDRRENIRRAGHVARLFANAGTLCIAAFISPYREDRDRVRSLMPPGGFVEVYINAPLAVCEQRDVKGLYARARSGGIAEFTGITAPYEPPLAPEFEIRTDELTVGESVACLCNYLLGLREAVCEYQI